MGVRPVRGRGWSWRWVVAAVAGAVVLTQVMAHRPDPAAEPGLQVAVVLLLQTDAALAAPASAPGPATAPDAGERAERAATVRRIWAEPARARRLEEVRGRPLESRRVRFVATRWVEVDAWADRGEAEVVGHVERRRIGQDWQADPERTYRVRLTRGDPVGRLRGWRLLQVGTGDVGA